MRKPNNKLDYKRTIKIIDFIAIGIIILLIILSIPLGIFFNEELPRTIHRNQDIFWD